MTDERQPRRAAEGVDGSSTRDDDEDRAAILARRARFVASALAGLALGACEPSMPQPCLNIAPVEREGGPEDAGVGDAVPLDAGPSDGGPGEPDGAAPRATEPDASAGPAADPPPGPCLRVAAPRPSSAGSSSAAPPAATTVRPPGLPRPEGTFPAPCLKVAPPQTGR